MDEARIKLLSGPSWLQRPLRMPTLQPRSYLNDCTRSGTNNDDWWLQVLINSGDSEAANKTVAGKRSGLLSYTIPHCHCPLGHARERPKVLHGKSTLFLSFFAAAGGSSY